MAWDRERIRERIRSFLLGAAALVLIGLVFYLGARTERSGFVQEVLDPGFRKLSDPVLNAFRGRPPAVAKLKLLLAPEAFDSLEARSEQAYRDRHVTAGGSKSFAARLIADDRELAVVVSLREGAAQGTRERFWPLYVRALPGDTIQGMQSFDVFPIGDEAPLWSMVLHGLLADMGQVSPGAGLAEVEINGTGAGLCALFGRIDATMLAHWPRGSGPVLRFDEDLLLNAKAELDERSFGGNTPVQGDWLAAPMLLQGAGGERLAARARKAVQRMEGFRSGTLKASQVFAPEALARTIALCDLLGTTSAMDWWNLRFLVDSVSGELVPVPLHTTLHAPIERITAEHDEVSRRTGREVVDRALNDPVIRDLYMACLDTFSTEGWWDVARERTRPRWEAVRRAVNAELPRVDLDMAVVAHDRNVIRQALYPHDMALAYVSDTLANTDGVVIANVHALPIEVVGVVLSSGDTTLLPTALRLEPRLRDRPLRYTFLPLNVPGSPREVLVRIAPTLKPRAVRIRTWSSFGAN
ncbi:MAG: hypothetical protein KF797_09440 [Flavobacteriales bacterium]|nr:hypothetical protein [Flavobacteriales bacterium]